MIDRWIEPFAGMLAVGLWLQAKADPPMAYMGGKRGYRDSILLGLGLYGGAGSREVWLADADAGVAAFWRALAAGDVPDLSEYDAIRASDPIAAFHAGRSAGTVAGWTAAAALAYRAGNPSSGTGIGSRQKVSLLSVQRAAEAASRAIRGARVFDAAGEIPIDVIGRTVVLIDPPYAGTTGYAAGCSRAEVIDLAERWFAAGAEVVITERECVVPTWRCVEIKNHNPRATRGAWEFATISPNIQWRNEQGTLFALPERAPDGSLMSGGVGKSLRRTN